MQYKLTGRGWAIFSVLCVGVFLILYAIVAAVVGLVSQKEDPEEVPETYPLPSWYATTTETTTTTTEPPYETFFPIPEDHPEGEPIITSETTTKLPTASSAAITTKPAPTTKPPTADPATTLPVADPTPTPTPTLPAAGLLPTAGLLDGETLECHFEYGESIIVNEGDFSEKFRELSKKDEKFPEGYILEVKIFLNPGESESLGAKRIAAVTKMLKTLHIPQEIVRTETGSMEINDGTDKDGKTVNASDALVFCTATLEFIYVGNK